MCLLYNILKIISLPDTLREFNKKFNPIETTGEHNWTHNPQ